MAQDVTSNQKNYWCFISYRHSDNAQQGRQWATWLQDKIEKYEVPPELIGTKNSRGETVPQKIFPVFRDEAELPANANLEGPIYSALENSKFLLVLCSPSAVASNYVNDEILYFKKLGKDEHVLAAIISGEPNPSLKSNHSQDQECFPLPLKFHVDSSGNIDSSFPIEPLAADFRLDNGDQGWISGTDYSKSLRQKKRHQKKQIESLVSNYERKKETAFLKIIAGILGLPLGSLTQRDREHQLEVQRKRIKRLRQVAAGIFTLTVIATFAAAIALSKSQEATTEKNKALASESKALKDQKALEVERLRLDKVVAFQKGMLSQLNQVEAGKTLTEEVNKSVEEIISIRSKNPKELSAATNTYKQLTNGINYTTAAQNLIDIEILQRSTTSITAGFTEDPITAADLYMTIGDIYDSYERNTKALDLFQTAWELRKKTLGEDDDKTLFANLKRVLKIALKPAGENEIKNLLKDLQRKKGNTNSDVLTLQNALGLNLASQGKLAEAEKLLLDLKVKLKSKGKLQPNHLIELAWLYRQKRQIDISLSYLNEAQELTELTSDVNANFLQESYYSRALNLFIMKDYDEAKKYLDRALNGVFTRQGERFAMSGMLASKGHQNQFTENMIYILALIDIAEGAYEKASGKIKRILESYQKSFGLKHIATLEVLHAGGLSALGSGDNTQAEEIFRLIKKELSERLAQPEFFIQHEPRRLTNYVSMKLTKRINYDLALALKKQSKVNESKMAFTEAQTLANPQEDPLSFPIDWDQYTDPIPISSLPVLGSEIYGLCEPIELSKIPRDQHIYYDRLNDKNIFEISSLSTHHFRRNLNSIKNIRFYTEKEGVIYLGPFKPNKEASIHFIFPKPDNATKANLTTSCDLWDFSRPEFAGALGKGRGAATLECSSDGKKWIPLLDDISDQYWGRKPFIFNNHLPEDSLKGSFLHVRLRMIVEDRPLVSNYTVAQFGRSNRTKKNESPFLKLQFFENEDSN